MQSKNIFTQPKMIRTNEIELEVFEAGKENYGNPVILCHGWPEIAYSWRHQVPVLVKAGFHVIIPNQRGFGNSSRPKEVEKYDIENLTSDLIGLLDHFGYESSIFIGHDWGANIIWSLAQIHPKRVKKIINLALPYQERGEVPWLDMMEKFLGCDNYFVHFNRKPGVADKILEENTQNFFHHLFRKNIPSRPQTGMLMIELATQKEEFGEEILSPEELNIYTDTFCKSGFTSNINWYRNINRNWHFLKSYNPIINHPTLMIYGKYDSIPQSETIFHFVPNVEIVTLDCGHWIQQEAPMTLNKEIISWLKS